VIDPGEGESLAGEDRAIQAEILRQSARLTNPEWGIYLESR